MIRIISFTKAGRGLSLLIGDILDKALREYRIYYKGSSDIMSDYEDNYMHDVYRTESVKSGNNICRIRGPLSEWTEDVFNDSEAIIFIGAAGIAVRSIAPHIKDKYTDPAVIVIDEKGRFVIPILSGHVGGANELARMIADALHAQSVITTATDVNGLFAVDEFAARNDMIIAERETAKKISAGLLEGRTISVYVDPIWGKDIIDKIISDNGSFSDRVMITEKREQGDVIISVFTSPDESGKLHLIPKACVWIGTGCRKGTSQEIFEDSFLSFLDSNRIDIRAVAGLASVDLKEDEECIIKTADRYGLRFITFSSEKLMAQKGDFSSSAFVMEQTGADNVCERAAVAASGGKLISGKTKYPGITMAAAYKICN